jgi:hypothetical protein
MIVTLASGIQMLSVTLELPLLVLEQREGGLVSPRHDSTSTHVLGLEGLVDDAA